MLNILPDSSIDNQTPPPSPLLKSMEHAQELATKYDVPIEDILMIGLNVMGVRFRPSLSSNAV